MTAASSPRVCLGEPVDPRGPLRLQRLTEAVRRALGEDLLAQRPGEQVVHAPDRVTDGHRPGRVAVVAAADRQQARALWAPDAALVLQGHLEGDLDGHRAGVGEEDPLEPCGGQLAEPLGQADRRLVGQPAEHHVAIRPNCQVRAPSRAGLR